MTDEELKPFIGKKVSVEVRDFDDTYISLVGQLTTDGTLGGEQLYKVLPYRAVLYLAGAFKNIELLEPEKEPEKTIPKGFIEVTGINNNVVYIKASAILGVSVDTDSGKSKTSVMIANWGLFNLIDTADEIMTKIAEALNG